MQSKGNSFLEAAKLTLLIYIKGSSCKGTELQPIDTLPDSRQEQRGATK